VPRGLCRGIRAFSRNWMCSFFNGMANPLMMDPSISSSSAIPLCLGGRVCYTSAFLQREYGRRSSPSSLVNVPEEDLRDDLPDGRAVRHELAVHSVQHGLHVVPAMNDGNEAGSERGPEVIRMHTHIIRMYTRTLFVCMYLCMYVCMYGSTFLEGLRHRRVRSSCG
jgi:hypothetical protein